MRPHRLAVIPGDGVGPEVIEAAVEVLLATGAPLEIKRFEAGDGCLAKWGVPLPQETVQGALEADAVLFGAAGSTAADVILRLRRELGTYVNLRPAKALAGVKCLYPQTNLVIVRENTECLYAGIESRVAPGVVTATRVITEEASTRIAQFAFKYAREQGFSRVTAIHKANVLKESDGLFLRCARSVAKGFPDLEYEEALVDSAAMLMVMQPARYQVLLTTNLFGDILSDLSAALLGGLGLCPSANLGVEHALFEPVHGTAPEIAGKGIANPCAAILCASMLLQHLGKGQEADSIVSALAAAVADGQTTPDLGGRLSTVGMAHVIIERMVRAD